MRILLDTNIFLRLAQPSHDMHAVTRQAIFALDHANVEMCLNPQVLYEFWSTATRPAGKPNGLGMSIPQVIQSLADLIDSYEFLEDDVGLFDRWRTLVATHAVQGKPSHDARFVAAMMYHGITNFLTFNTSDFKRFKNITVLTPEDIVAGKMPL